MKVLVIGTGGREHALALALSRDPGVEEVHAAPGNPGIAAFATLHDVDQLDGDAVSTLAEKLGVDLVVIGPEAPLVAGVADDVRARGISCFGPSGAAAELEGSKAFAKDVMAAAGVNTATSLVVDNPAHLDAALARFTPPYVVKDDGLAAGKGVVVSSDLDIARAHASTLLEGGHPVLLESYLDGPEVSLFCLVDGETVVPLLPAQDFKRVGDDDTGPNTGGMGAYAPLPWASPALADELASKVVAPVAAELARRATPFSGLLYAGLVLTAAGPAVIEFNCRFGDPETQVVLALLRSPLARLLHATATGRLAEEPPPQWADGAAVTVVVAAEGYPGPPRVGDVITGAEGPGVLHAGTRRRDDGAVVSSGGRVLSVVGTGADLLSARQEAYQRLEQVHLAGSHHRTDIALRAAQGAVSVPAPS